MFTVVGRTARVVATCLVKLMCQHRVPAKIIHDQAPKFLSDILQDTVAILGVQQLCISNQKQPSFKKRSAALEKAMVKKDVKSKVAAKKWL